MTLSTRYPYRVVRAATADGDAVIVAIKSSLREATDTAGQRARLTAVEHYVMDSRGTRAYTTEEAA